MRNLETNSSLYHWSFSVLTTTLVPLISVVIMRLAVLQSRYKLNGKNVICNGKCLRGMCRQQIFRSICASAVWPGPLLSAYRITRYCRICRCVGISSSDYMISRQILTLVVRICPLFFLWLGFYGTVNPLRSWRTRLVNLHCSPLSSYSVLMHILSSVTGNRPSWRARMPRRRNNFMIRRRGSYVAEIESNSESWICSQTLPPALYYSSCACLFLTACLTFITLSGQIQQTETWYFSVFPRK